MNLPKRKSIRLREYDYNTPGAYFITICIHERKCLLSHIVGAIHESPANELPTNELTQCGELVQETIEKLPDRYNVEIPKYIIMPNHIHMIVVIKCDDTAEWAIRESPLQIYRSVMSRMVGYLKMNTSKKMHLIYPYEKIWQRDYFDHIIRNEEEYKRIWEYIDTNVIKWAYDRFYEE